MPWSATNKNDVSKIPNRIEIDCGHLCQPEKIHQFSGPSHFPHVFLSFARFKVPFQLLQCYGRMAHGLKFHAGITSQDTQQNVLATGMLQQIPLKVKLELGKQWEYADFIGEESRKWNENSPSVFRTYLWSILNSNCVMITLWRLTRKPSQKIVLQCQFDRNELAGSHGSSTWKPRKLIANPQSFENIFHASTLLGIFIQTSVGWKYLWFATPQLKSLFPLWIRCFFDSSKNPWWVYISEIVEHLKAVRPFDEM